MPPLGEVRLPLSFSAKGEAACANGASGHTLLHAGLTVGVFRVMGLEDGDLTGHIGQQPLHGARQGLVASGPSHELRCSPLLRSPNKFYELGNMSLKTVFHTKHLYKNAQNN